MKKPKNIVLYFACDERLLDDSYIRNLLSELKFKATLKNKRLFVKSCTEYNLKDVAKRISCFYYENGKRRELKCSLFNSYYEGKCNNLEWVEKVKERNNFCYPHSATPKQLQLI